ncbi:DUF982 domain-containing protein [Brucella anthropi]|uniref:DUF982 domain-containing protein n=1 Tax=Brucella anthropi TaxID=529 RepID=UPI003CC7E77E
MKWVNPIAVYIYDTFYSIRQTSDAEQFFLRHWIIFRPEHRDKLVMACLMSWDGNAALTAKARRIFVDAARAAGILVCAEERRPMLTTPQQAGPAYLARPFSLYRQDIIEVDHCAEAGGTASVVAAGKEFSPSGVFSSGEMTAP